jgi:hypothetical protein
MHQNDEEEISFHSPDVNLPRVFNGQTKVMIGCEFDRRLDVTCRASVNADNWNIPLLTRHTKGGVQVACANGPVFENEALEVG